MKLFGNKYTDEIEVTRDEIQFYFNLSLVKVLCVERIKIGKANEETVICYIRPNGTYAEHRLECSRDEHYSIVQEVITLSTSEKHKTTNT